MVATTDFEEEMPPTIQLGEKSEEELMGLIQRRWQLRLRSIIFLRAGVGLLAIDLSLGVCSLSRSQVRNPVGANNF
ncbi:hypothetical protein MTR67_013845 [Solanum verrucosum]|uniref:Uncharacterized protein n=1 Tax=Solanum verrucosum TaxID=315347 RepID=A0AAF0QFS1_SOLVR|nr:hypothetical protein MTR67_013845 [Solanum verrucosum]